MGLDDLEQVRVSSREELRAWFEAHAESSPSIWLILPRTAGAWPAPTYDEVVEEALCFGWIDSTTRPRDETSRMMLVARRKPRSTWSTSNKVRLERLIAEGRMTPLGMAAAERAKANGAWELLELRDSVEMPDDLAGALAERPGAMEYFDTLPPGVRRDHLWFVVSAKRAQTRASRIQKVVDAAAEGRRIT